MPKSATIGIIYAGGTFGSHGNPLKSLDNSTFLPILTDILEQHFAHKTTTHWQILPNPIVKDSSQLTPADFAHFYQLIIQAYQSGIYQFVLLTGTDTLSYLAAFLAHSLADSDICVIVTGAMQPLLQPLSPKYTLNPASDASKNLLQSCHLALTGTAGVYACFAYDHWPAQTVQKIHSHDTIAFTGHQNAGYPATSYHQFTDKQFTTKREIWLTQHLENLDNTLKNLANAKILPIFLTPMSGDDLANLLQNMLKHKPDALILLGFGAGNLPHSQAVEQALIQAYTQNCLVAISTQCPFGGVSNSYQAGAWLNEFYVFNTESLTVATIFARLLWLVATVNQVQNRRQVWQKMLKKN
ncbi:asparaginase/glutaminase [Moraxella macacae 0408225]|uniref:Asparaginase/glutaminase n=1 Tax=Moraxella macacae 0408225 TaxID=1230338 RepID=L2F4V1_9GAMM|nr:asparaginase domain-containing protein [Moraxella macacae]ELA08049.1 asparaginase/glutaminase [Moraxella macacae 0408225]